MTDVLSTDELAKLNEADESGFCLDCGFDASTCFHRKAKATIEAQAREIARKDEALRWTHNWIDRYQQRNALQFYDDGTPILSVLVAALEASHG